MDESNKKVKNKLEVICTPDYGQLLTQRSNFEIPKKSARLFGQLNTRGGGGGNLPILGNFHSRPTNSILYESWHILLKFDTLLRLLSLKLRPQEVAEVAKSRQKKINQRFWNWQFLSYKNVIPQKKAEKVRHSDLKQN